MNVRTRFNIAFTILTAGVLILFAGSIFLSSKKIRQKEFYEVLRKEAFIKANLFLETDLSTEHLEFFYSNINESSDKISLVLYDEAFNELYRNFPATVESDSLRRKFEEIYTAKGYELQQQIQSIATTFKISSKDYYVLSSGKDTYGQEELIHLLKILGITAFVAILLLYALSLYFSKRIFSPVTEMTQDINKITTAHLDLRLKSHNYKGELNKLASIFNQMLDRLENSFDSQKEFVAHISHELRTPLAAIIIDMQLALSQTHSKDEYRETLERSLTDAKKIVKLSNNLLDLAKANYDPLEVGYTSLRIDEVLLDACQDAKKAIPDCSIQIEFESDSIAEELMTVMGNPYLLNVACKNLIENACKFSKDKHCLIRIGHTKKMVRVEFIDNGIGISEEELEHIFVAFYRGSQQDNYEGYGIGLPLTQKILQQHKGKIKVKSSPKHGSTFTIYLPHRAGN